MKKISPKETAEHRRKRLRMWIDENFDRSQSAFIDDASKRSKKPMNQGELSAILSGKKSFGEKKARSLETQGGMPFMWLDDDNSPPQEPSDDDFEIVPQLNVEGGCGNGRFVEHISVKGGLVFKISYLRHIGVSPESARIITSEGESMSPTIKNNRAVLIDTSDKRLANGGVYLILDHEGACLIKRLVKEYYPATNKTEWLIRSDNPDKVTYPDMVFPRDDSFTIIGRAKWNDNRL